MRRRAAVVVLALALAGCKRTATEPVAPAQSPAPPVAAAATPAHPSEVVVLGHATCVTMKACVDALQPMLARSPMPPSLMTWYGHAVDDARPGSIVVIQGAERPDVVYVLPLRADVDPHVGKSKDHMRFVDGHAFIGSTDAMAELATGIDLSLLQPSPAPGLVVDGRIELAALPPEVREQQRRRIAETQAGTNQVLREVVPFGLAIDALDQADSCELDVLQVDGHFELDAVIRPRPGTRLAERAAANAGPRTRLAAAIPTDAILQAGIVERIVLPIAVRVSIGAVMKEALAKVAVELQQGPGTEARKRLVGALATDVAELASAYFVRDEPVEVAAFLPADSTTMVLLLRGVDPALAERMASSLVALARDQGIKSAHTTRQRGLTIHGATFPTATHRLADRLGRNAVVRAAMAGDTFVVVVGGDRKPTDLRTVAKALERAEERAAPNRWFSVDFVEISQLLALDTAFVKGLPPTDGTVAASLTSDGRAWQLRMRMDALSPSNLARGMKEKTP